MQEDETPIHAPLERSCNASGGFNYCRFSKTLVAIVLFPLVARIVSYFF